MMFRSRNVENRLAIVGALLILTAVGFAASAAFNDRLDLDFPLQGHSSALVANAR